LKSEEEHMDWLQTQLRLMDRLGMEAYLQTQVHTEE
ncbi:MAG: bacterioferritin, partial [Alphaproteobacteria bacterium]